MEAGRRFQRDDIQGQAAKLAFYLLLSLFPVLLLLMSLLGWLIESRSELEASLHRYLSTIMPPAASALIDRTLAEVMRGPKASTLSLSLLFLWWAATRAMRAVIEGLNAAYRVDEVRKWWRRYLVAVALTLALVVAVGVTLLCLSVGRNMIASTIGSADAPSVWAAWKWVRWAVILALAVVAFRLVYVYGPSCPRGHQRSLMTGTVFGVAVWLGASIALRVYLENFARFTVTYGSIGGVIVLLLWLYLSSLALLLGAEVNALLDQRIERGRQAPVATSA